MSVIYASVVKTSTFGCFVKLLARWRGSVYRILWKELIIYLVLYYIISFSYRFAMTADQKSQFKEVVFYFRSLMNEIPLGLVLGFYISEVISRYFRFYWCLPWPMPTCILLTTYLPGQDDRGRQLRRTIIRYLVLSYIETFRSLSPPIRKRFPSLCHLITCGMLTDDERKIIEEIHPNIDKCLMPLVWAAKLVMTARVERRIQDDYAVAAILKKLNVYEQQCRRLFLFTSISIPLVYTQIVTLAVYMRFTFSLLESQFLESSVTEDDIYVPVSTIIEFIFYVGLHKVAEALINPFGFDDEDYDIDALITRHSSYAYVLVDDVNRAFPELVETDYSLASNDTEVEELMELGTAEHLVMQKELYEHSRRFSAFPNRADNAHHRFSAFGHGLSSHTPPVHIPDIHMPRVQTPSIHMPSVHKPHLPHVHSAAKPNDARSDQKSSSMHRKSWFRPNEAKAVKMHVATVMPQFVPAPPTDNKRNAFDNRFEDANGAPSHESLD